MSEKKSLNGWIDEERRRRREDRARDAALRKLGELVLRSRNELAEMYPLGFTPSLGEAAECHILTLKLLSRIEK